MMLMMTKQTVWRPLFEIEIEILYAAAAAADADSAERCSCLAREVELKIDS